MRQAFETCGYSAVGWTYPYNGHGLQSYGLGEVSYTCWDNTVQDTLLGVAGNLLDGMSHSIIGINGPWNSPTERGTDPSDANHAQWDCSRFYFRYIGTTDKIPLPITGIYSSDVDGSSEKRYFPLRDGYSVGPSDIWIKASSSIDSTPPTMTITADEISSGETSADYSSLTLHFTSSETTTTFYSHNVNVQGGSLSNFTGSGLSYSALFSADVYGVKTITVNSNSFTDMAGNENVAASNFEWNYNQRPDFTIELSLMENSHHVTSESSVNVLMNLSHVPTENCLDLSDIIVYDEDGVDVTGSSLSNLQVKENSQNLQYSFQFTPPADGSYRVQVKTNSCTNEDGDANLASNAVQVRRDTVKPTVSITSLEGDSPVVSSDLSALRLKFTVSEDVSDFDLSDVSVEGGMLSSFTGTSSSIYEATLTPEQYVNGDTPIGTYTEAGGCPSGTRIISDANACENAKSDLNFGGTIETSSCNELAGT